MVYIRRMGHFLNRYTAPLLFLVCAARYAVLHQWLVAATYLFVSAGSIRLVRRLHQPTQEQGSLRQGPKG